MLLKSRDAFEWRMSGVFLGCGHRESADVANSSAEWEGAGSRATQISEQVRLPVASTFHPHRNLSRLSSSRTAASGASPVSPSPSAACAPSNSSRRPLAPAAADWQTAPEADRASGHRVRQSRRTTRSRCARSAGSPPRIRQTIQPPASRPPCGPVIPTAACRAIFHRDPPPSSTIPKSSRRQWLHIRW